MRDKQGADKPAVTEWLRERGLLSRRWEPASSDLRIVATYDYMDERDELLYQNVRYEPKDFKQRRPDGKGGWSWNLNGVRRVLYRLSAVLTAKSVLVVEGEKDAETGCTLGLTATCNTGGAGKWREEYSECLCSKRVAIIADADGPGRKHAQQIATSLHGKTESLKVLELPGAKDLSEWVKRGGTRATLLDLIHNASEWKPQFSTATETPLIALSVEDLLAREIKPREMLLEPIVPEQGLAMLYAYPWPGTASAPRRARTPCFRESHGSF